MEIIKKVIKHVKNKWHHFQCNIAYKREIKNIQVKLRRTDKAAIVIGSVEYANLGDQAICLAQVKFTSNYLPVFEVRDSLFSKHAAKIKKMVRSQDVIVIPGGGNMGDIWMKDEERRRRIIKEYPHNKIIIFPQTIDYSNTLEGERYKQESITIYNSHNNLAICAREQSSFEIMQKIYSKNKIILVPDIVLSLKPEIADKKKQGVLFCFRNDVEKKLSADKIKEIEKSIERYGHTYIYTDTVQAGNIKQIDREKLILEKIEMLAGAKLVITDRLHGMIFCAISKTPCLVFSNNNHKIKGVYDTWLKNNPLIKFYDDFNIKMLEEDMKRLFEKDMGEQSICFNQQNFEGLIKELI